ncbi:retrotransposon gag domain-containing protein, partial [Heyndrickxia coagulans]|uniref:retrotransposon gag domain-containing protein n=1 Tax=Heyndrickxia coagulans TaxID=1398 RepID=UPI00214D900A|nr:retrotransposon gag domain-containing protein [Heyndrickxia coagulans]
MRKKKKTVQNKKLIIFLVNAMDINEYNKIKHCRIAKEIWRLLEVTYEGTDQVKQSKLNLFEQAYELFKMKPNETVDELYARFTEIVNSLMLNGKILSKQEKVSRLLRSLLNK